jgi:amino acid adenylation domain-containing protein
VAALPVQYADYSVWLAQRSGERHAQLAYWTDRLAGPLPVLELPADRARPAMQSYRSGSVRCELAAPAWAAVRTASSRASVTSFVFLLSSYIATLARWSGQDDFVVGTASANRTRPETENVVGLFVNTIAIRAAVDVREPFTALLETVKQAAVGAFVHQEVPFDEIVRALNPPRDLSRAIVFQTLFVLNNMPLPELRMGNLDVEPVDASTGATEYDVAVWVTERDAGARVSVEFNADVFDATTIERLMEHWMRLLGASAADPTTNIDSLPLLADDERQTVLTQWAKAEPAPPPDHPTRLDELLTLRVLATPDAVAFEHDGDTMTYRQLDDRSNRLAHRLIHEGVRTGDHVGVAVDRSLAMVVSVFGVLKAGAAYVPLDPAYPPERLAFMMADAAVELVLISPGALWGVDTSATTVIELAAGSDELERWPATSPGVDTGDSPGGGVAWVIYTSGSTGRPKGVVVEHASAIDFAYSMLRAPGVSGDDVVLALATLSFDPSALDLFVPMLVGARVVIASREHAMDGRRLSALIASSGATVMQATPTTLSMLFESGWTGSDQLKVLCGGEAMPVEQARRLRAGCRSVWNVYGPTETTVWSTVHEVVDASLDHVNVPIGRPVGTTVCRVLDETGGLCPIGVAGELYIGGAGVARGYLNRDDLTRERFVVDPYDPSGRLYRSGDLVRWLPDGSLEFLGRRDFQVKVRGHRIELGEIESALRAHGAVSDAAVISDGTGTAARLLGYVVPVDRERPPTVAELRRWLEERLPAYMIPARFVALDAFPTTPTRKIDRTALPRQEATVVGGAPFVAPRNAVERLMARIFAETLELEQLGMDDNFFELGGHSLHATSILAKVAATFGIDIPLRTFFQNPTVAAVSHALSGDGAARVERIAELRLQLESMSPEDVAALLAAKRAGRGSSA